MAKYLIETYYTCSFKVNHYLDNINESELSLNECIDTYLFNSQVIIKEKDSFLLCPMDVKNHPKTYAIVEQWKKNGPFKDILYTHIKSSLMNGGGPACLRLSIYLSTHEIQKVPTQFKLTDSLIQKIETIINRDYPKNINLNHIQKNPNLYRKIVMNIESLFAKKQ